MMEEDPKKCLMVCQALELFYNIFASLSKTQLENKVVNRYWENSMYLVLSFKALPFSWNICSRQSHFQADLVKENGSIKGGQCGEEVKVSTPNSNISDFIYNYYITLLEFLMHLWR